MKRASRRDANEPPIVEGLRAGGCSVTLLDVPGVPDLLVGLDGVNVLLEVKDPNAARGRSQALKLTDAQSYWHTVHKGQVAIVETLEQSWAVVRAVVARSKRELRVVR